MNLRQLEAFRATMRSGSITEAARMMNISQPSVSRLISDLEYSIGFELFLRSGRGLAPTIDANTFYHGVEGMFAGMGRLRELAETIRTTNEGVISIAAIQSIGLLELPRAVSSLYKRHKDIRFMIQLRNTPAILDAVQMKQFDLGIVGRQPDYEGVETLFKTKVRYVCLMPEDHDLVGQSGSVDLESLVDIEEFVTFGGTFPDEMMAMDPALSQKMQKRSRISATNLPVAAAMVRETGVLAIIDPFSAEQAVLMGGVVFRPIKQKLHYHISVITPGREYLSRPALELADIIIKKISTRVTEVSEMSE